LANTSKFSPKRVQEQKDIKSTELTADIFFLSAGVLAIGTTIIAFMTDWDGDPNRSDAPPKPNEAARLHLTPQLAPGYAGFSLKGGL